MNSKLPTLNQESFTKLVSANQSILLRILRQQISDSNIIWLLKQVIASFYSTALGLGLPLGNLTSQLFANVYLNDLDQFIKHELKLKYYVRYADDFVILNHDRDYLFQILPAINSFLLEKLKLTLHPDKVSIKTFASGPDFLGWIHFPDHRVLRTITQNRMFKKLKDMSKRPEVVQSYLGLLKWGNTYKIREKVVK